MEKDYFDDRSYQAIHNSLLEPGDVVYVCEKHMQRQINSSDIKMLTKGIIVSKLTSVKKHPRGIKVRIYPIKEGRYPTDEEIARVLRYYEKNKDEIESEMTPMILKFRKGRVTYVVGKDNKIIKG